MLLLRSNSIFLHMKDFVITFVKLTISIQVSFYFHAQKVTEHLAKIRCLTVSGFKSPSRLPRHCGT